MCGIAGFYRLQGALGPHDRQVLDLMSSTLSHRGPDDKGQYLEGNVGLAHRRLSIIDLESGHQPIYNEDRSIVTVYNGEIYNFHELRADLIKRGHRFSSKSDTEVLVHLYEDEGAEMVRRLRGMFAFALWDIKKKKLVLVRDRLGIKPLFTAKVDGQVIFGSEIKAILAHPSVNKQLNYAGLHDYLSFMTTTGRMTMFEGIERLLPGEMMIVTPEGMTRRTYWDGNAPGKRSAASPKLFEERLRDAVRSHLISDVPLGAFLSGGLDSSAIVALMAGEMDRPVKTFSIGFSGDKYFDETSFAKEVSRHLNTEHHEFRVTPDLIQTIPKVLDQFDEPFAVSSAFPTYFLAQMAREHVKVVLTGDGADELLGGYHHRYQGIHYGRIFDTLPFLKAPVFEKMLCAAAKGKSSKVKKFYRGLRIPARERYFYYMTKFQESEKFDLYSDDTKTKANDFDSIAHYLQHYNLCSKRREVEKWMYMDLRTSLPDEMLTKVDRMTMAFGLEARVPFLDHEFVEYGLQLPLRWKLKGGEGKLILRNMLKNKLPESIWKREKHGFEVPVDDWIRHDLKDFTRDILSSERVERSGIFHSEPIQRILIDHWDGRRNLGHQIWILLMFQIWHEKHFA